MHLRPGDLLVIASGVEHCPRVDGEEAHFLLIGPDVTSNAADGKLDWRRATQP